MKSKINVLVIVIIGVFLFACDKADDNNNNNNNNDDKTPADFTLNWSKTLGTTEADDFCGAVLGSDGNLYLTGVSQPDGYAADIFLTQIDLTAGTIGWARTLDLGDRDYYPSPSENGHSQGGGGSRCISLDDGGNIYIAGTTKQGFNEVFTVKFDNSGSLVWEKFWHANSSGNANGAAKAFALDVAGQKVFVTGSTGAGIGTEESQAFLLTLDATNGDLDSNATHIGIEISAGYNDRGYTIISPDGNDVYIAGWEGLNNSGFLMKFTDGGDTLSWFERVDIGTGCRLTDIDIDASGNIYLAADIRGVPSYMGIVKLNSTGALEWAKKYQGEANDRNNISCLRLINGSLYVGGKGSFYGYDVSQWGDACLLKISTAGELSKEYNYYAYQDLYHTGERIEGIFDYNGKILLAGETWPDGDNLAGSWYIPSGNYTDFSPVISVSTDIIITDGDGSFENRSFTVNTLAMELKDISTTEGSADIAIHSISE